MLLMEVPGMYRYITVGNDIGLFNIKFNSTSINNMLLNTGQLSLLIFSLSFNECAA